MFTKNQIFRQIFMIAVMTFFVSCSKEDELKNDVHNNAKVTSFLKSFYSENYNLGNSVETAITTNKLHSTNSRAVEVDNLLITEVFTAGSNVPRGYVFTSKETNLFVYFVDVDRVDFKLTSINIAANNSKQFENIDDLIKYATTNQFDIIKIALESDTNPNLTDRRRFWGSSYSQGPCDPETGLAQLYSDYYVIGIRVSHHPTVGEDGGDMFEPCGMH